MINSENHYQEKLRNKLLMIIMCKDNLNYYLSTQIAIPIPPPIQRVAKPFFTSLFIIS